MVYHQFMPEPSALLKSLAAARLRLLAELEDVRLSLAEVIEADIADGVRQVDVVKVTGYTREQIRRIVAGRTR
jgi:hypothetical protein